MGRKHASEWKLSAPMWRSDKPYIPTRTAHLHRHRDGFLRSHTLQDRLRASLGHLDHLPSCLFATARDHLGCSKLAREGEAVWLMSEGNNPLSSQSTRSERRA